MATPQTTTANPAPLPPAPAPGVPTASQTAQGPAPVQSTIAQPAITLVPLLNSPELKLQFGRMMTRRRVVTLHINPGAITRVVNRTYQSMVRTLGGVMDAPITQVNFLRITRTLMLKRVQDIVEASTGVRPDQPIRIARTMPLPQPIGELFYAIGTYYCQWNGIKYEITSSAPLVPPEDWRTLEPAQLANYRNFMEMTVDRYRQCPFPKLTDVIGQPLMMCVKDEVNNQCQIKSPGPIPTPADAFIKFVNEEFITDMPFAGNNCEYILTDRLYVDDVVSMYVNSYVISTHG